MCSCKNKFDIICLTETWCDQSILKNSSYRIPSYTLFEQPRLTGKKGGGLLMYISDIYSTTIRTKLSQSNLNSELLFIELSFANSKNLIVGVAYRPPNGKYEAFKNHLKSIINKITLEKKRICIAGDFNINALTYNTFPKTKSFFDMLFKHNVISVINKPTRVTRNTATAIDNILTNFVFETKYSSGIIKTDISDHFSIFFNFDLKCTKLENKKKDYIYKRNLSEISIENFRQCLRNQRWDETLSSKDANSAFEIFHNKFMNLFNESCP